MVVLYFAASKYQDMKDNREYKARVAENPELGRPVTEDEIAAFENWLDEQALPHIGLTPAPEAPILLQGTRLGGPAAARQGDDWPADKSGKPMLFLAQINFAELGDLPDFPASGILQFFIKSHYSFGTNYDDQLDPDMKIIWHADPLGLTESLAQRHKFKKRNSPFMTPEAQERGIPLTPLVSAPQRPNWDVFFVDQKIDEFCERPGGEEAAGEIFDAMEYSAHRIGGHPNFTQTDPRSFGDYQNYDRVLLQIGCDEHVMFGDSGECTFFITQEDLKARRFDRLLYNWDCC